MAGERCEPADPTKPGWHWLEDAAGQAVAWKWLPIAQVWRNHGPAWAVSRLGFRYLMPCPDPAELAALKAAALKAWHFYGDRKVPGCLCPECETIRALTTALEAASIKGIGDE